MSKIFHKTIRVLTIPPLLISSLLIILYFSNLNVFNTLQELLLSIFFLAIIPILAYPIISFYLRNSSNKEEIREHQRNLAFVLSLIGYISILVIGIIMNVSKELMLVYLTYFISVCILTVFNKLLKIRASGHSTSMIGPIVILFYAKLYYLSLIYVFLYILVFVSSLKLKRHTVKEFLIGSIIPLISLIFSIIIL